MAGSLGRHAPSRVVAGSASAAQRRSGAASCREAAPAGKAAAGARRACVRVRAAPTDSASSSSSSFGSFTSLLQADAKTASGAAAAASGLPSAVAGAAAAAAPATPAEVSLESEAGVDYTLLRDKLAAGEWELADNESRRLLCELAGEEAALREWVYFSEVKFIPAKDLQTMDALWRAYSGDRFGFSVQRQLWVAGRRQWGALFKRIGWVQGENAAYRKWPSEFLYAADAPKGHLPLTNCLRGTQLFQAVLEHPAFGGPIEAPEPPVWQSASKTSWLSGAGARQYSGEPPSLGLGLVVQAGALILLAALSAHFAPANF